MKQAQLAVFEILIFYLIAFGVIFFGVLHYAQAANKHSGPIDKCVVGKWSLDKSSLDRFYRSIVGDADNLELISSESKTHFTLTSGGDAAGNIYQKTTTRSKATSMNMESTVTIKGTSSAKFHADGQRLRYWDIKDNTKVILAAKIHIETVGHTGRLRTQF